MASDVELAGRTENPFHGGKIRPSSRWNEPRMVQLEHKIHPFHPSCTRIAPKLHREISTNSTGLAARFRHHHSSLYCVQLKYHIGSEYINKFNTGYSIFLTVIKYLKHTCAILLSEFFE
jgi:hypothetical protein